MLQRSHVAQQLLPHARWGWRKQKRSHHFLKASQTSFRREHFLERSVYQHPQILDTSGRLEVRPLPVDNAPQIPAQLENQIPMLKQKDPRLHNDQPIVQVTKEAHALPVRPLWNQSKNCSEHLRGSGQTETQGTELVDTSLETKPKIRPRSWMDRIWKHASLRSIENIQSPFLIDPNTDTTVSIWNFVNVTKPLRANKSMTGRQPPRHLLHQKQPSVEPQTGLVHRPPPQVPECEPTPRSKKEAPEFPVTQVGGDGTALCSHPGAPEQSTHRRRRTARNANADRVCLPPVAVRGVRNLQNFFPFLRREEEEEALEDDDEEEADWKDFPEEDPKDRLDCSCCCWRDCCEKCSFLPLCRGFSWTTILRMVSSWRTLEDLSTAFSKTSAGKSSVEFESLALRRSMKDSKEMESFTFARTVPRLLRTKLAHGVKAIFATRSWHLAPTRLRWRTRQAPLEDWRARDFMANVH